MAHVIDQEDVKHILDEQRKTADKFLKDGDIRGVLARAFDSHQALTVWRIGEANRRIDPNDVMSVIFHVFTNAVAAELESHVCQDCMNEAVARLTVEFNEQLKQTMTTIAQSPIVEAKEVGTA